MRVASENVLQLHTWLVLGMVIEFQICHMMNK